MLLGRLKRLIESAPEKVGNKIFMTLEWTT